MTLVTTTVNVFEILFGAEYSQNEKNIKEVCRILDGLEIFAFGLQAAEEAGFRLNTCGEELVFQFMICLSHL